MTVEDFKNQNKLEVNLTQKDSVGLKTIYNEFKKAEKIETGKALEELDLLKKGVRNEVVYIMEYGEGYLVEPGDTISHINAMLPKGYSIKISNPKYLLSNSNIRVTVKNDKLLINGEINHSSSIRWGEDEEAKKNFDNYKASKWAKNCFMVYDNEKNIYVADEGNLVINSDEIKTLDDLKQKTIEYREIKADEQAVKIAGETDVVYDKEKNMYIAENGKFITTRDSVKDAYELKIKIIEYREMLANEQAGKWSTEAGISYDVKKKQYSYRNSELIIDRDKINSLDELKKTIYDFDEKLAEELALDIADTLKNKGVVYDSKKQKYIVDGGKLICSRNNVSSVSELEYIINKYLERLETEKIRLETEKKRLEEEKMAENIAKKIEQPKFIEYTVKGGDILWNIIRRKFQELGMENKKNKSIGNYYNEKKEEIVSINNLRLDKKGNPIIITGKTIKLPTLQIVEKNSTKDPLENTPKTKEVKQILDSVSGSTNIKKSEIVDDNIVFDLEEIPNKESASTTDNLIEASDENYQNSMQTIAEEMDEMMGTLLPKNIRPEKKDDENVGKEISISSNEKPIEESSEKVDINNLKNRVKEIILQDTNLVEKNILGIDVKEKKYNIHEIIVYMRLLGPIKRVFQSNIGTNPESIEGKEKKHDTLLLELVDSKINYLFRIYLKSIKEKDMENISIYIPEKDTYIVRYSLYGEEGFERIFQKKEKKGEIYFEETTEMIELNKAELQRKMTEHGLNVTFMYPTSFAEKVIVDGYKTHLYKCKFTEPNNEQILIGQFYIDKKGVLREFLQTKKTI